MGGGLWVCSAGASARLDEEFADAIEAGAHGVEGGAALVCPQEVRTAFGRVVDVPQAAGDACRFSFDQLCQTDLGASCYRALLDRYGTLVLDDVPQLGTHRHDESRRFIVLIDQVYESGTRLIASAAVPPSKLFDERNVRLESDTLPRASHLRLGSLLESTDGGGAPDPASDAVLVDVGQVAATRELSFAFRRAASRITELCSVEAERA